MKRRWLYTVLLLLVAASLLIIGGVSRQATAQEPNDSTSPPADYQPIPVEPGPLPLPLGEAGIQATSVALIMDVLPWGASAWTTLLPPMPTTVYNSPQLTSDPTIWNHDLIIVAEDQPNAFYGALAANMSKFDNYLKTKCGVVVFSMSAWGWNGGNASSVVLPGGVGIALNLQWNNYVVQPTHPMVTTPNLIPTTMAGTFASHAHFTNYGSANVIITTGTAPSNEPTLMEYPYGSGHVIATTHTLSFGWQYSQDAGKLMQNIVKYAKEFRPPCSKTYTYSVKFVCGMNKKTTVDFSQVLRGAYSTEINIHNVSNLIAPLQKRLLVLVKDGLALGREPKSVGVTAVDAITLPPDWATMDDCQRIGELVYQMQPGLPFTSMPLTIGFLEIISPVELRVDAVYTTQNSALNGVPVIDVENITPTVSSGR